MFNNQKKNYKLLPLLSQARGKKDGSILLLALLVMGAMMIVGISSSILTSKQIRQTSEIKKSVIAFYTSETAVEEALYLIKKEDKSLSDLSGYKAGYIDNGKEYLGWGNNFSSYFDPNATSTLVFQEVEQVVYDKLKENEIVSLDLYNPDSISESGTIKSISLEWDGKPASWLEVSWRSLTPGSPYFSEDVELQKMLTYYEEDVRRVINLTAGVGQQSTYIMHSVQIKALYDEVKNLRVKAYSDTGGNTMVDIPSRLYVSSTGGYPAGSANRARQNITVAMPQKIPLSPMFDYVIFTEEDLIKRILVTGSKTPQLIYEDCGPYAVIPACSYTFSNGETKVFSVKNIGIDDATLGDFSLDPVYPHSNPWLTADSPVGFFTINAAGTTCDEGLVLPYNMTCNVSITARSIPNTAASATLNVATGTPVQILLDKPRGR